MGCPFIMRMLLECNVDLPFNVCDPTFNFQLLKTYNICCHYTPSLTTDSIFLQSERIRASSQLFRESGYVEIPSSKGVRAPVLWVIICWHISKMVTVWDIVINHGLLWMQHNTLANIKNVALLSALKTEYPWRNTYIHFSCRNHNEGKGLYFAHEK